MKVYCFYLYQEQILADEFPGVKVDTITELSNGLEISLYAFTNNKKYAKFFRETRNMEIFVEQKVNMSEKDYEDFCEKYSVYYLDKCVFTVRKKEKGIYDSTYQHIICTSMEYDSICYSEEILLDNLIYTTVGNIGEFLDIVEFMRPEIKEAMKMLCYEAMLNFYVPLDLYDHDNEYDNEIMIDQFKMYLLVFGRTFKGSELYESL